MRLARSAHDPGDRRRVRALRDHASELRRLADAITDAANELEAELSTAPLLGGRALVDAAVAVLLKTPDRTMHYKQLLAAVEATTSRQVRGVAPAATLLANLDRDPRVRSCGDRSGRYVLADVLTLAA
jgi:hypothetical protein